MVEIGSRPILWHLMKVYSAHGVNDFVVAAGYKSSVIKDFFANYVLHRANVSFDLRSNTTTLHGTSHEPWHVTIVETGADAMTGGRLRRCAEYLDGETFCLAYGDCVADIDIGRLVSFHREQGVLVTLTAVQPPGRFGALVLGEHENLVRSFHEKPGGDGAWVNGGFFVLEPDALSYISGDDSVWEREPLEQLAANDQLAAYRHKAFWQPMDTLRDKIVLEELWESGSAPWQVW